MKSLPSLDIVSTFCVTRSFRRQCVHKRRRYSSQRCILDGSLSPPRYPSGNMLASNAGGIGFNPESRTASFQRRYQNRMLLLVQCVSAKTDGSLHYEKEIMAKFL